MDILQLVKRRDPGEKEFHQAVQEVMESVKPVLDRHPEYEETGALERIVEPERMIIFRVPWMDDNGEILRTGQFRRNIAQGRKFDHKR